MTTGFEETLKACADSGLDLQRIPVGVLRIFFNSGMSFAEGPGALSSTQKQTWRDSVIFREKKKVKSR